jgi:hypothetical protein
MRTILHLMTASLALGLAGSAAAQPASAAFSVPDEETGGGHRAWQGCVRSEVRQLPWRQRRGHQESGGRLYLPVRGRDGFVQRWRRHGPNLHRCRFRQT